MKMYTCLHIYIHIHVYTYTYEYIDIRVYICKYIEREEKREREG